MDNIQQGLTHRKPVDPSPIERLSYRVPEICAATGLSRSKVFQLIHTGVLPSKLIAGCRVVTRAALLGLLQDVE